jgi:hypothetical protein
MKVGRFIFLFYSTVRELTRHFLGGSYCLVEKIFARLLIFHAKDAES